MPIFNYLCQDCGNEFEFLIVPSMPRDAKPDGCPKCNSAAVEKALSMPAISTEGSRESALQKARKRNSKMVQEKETEEFKQIVAHANEHH